MNFYKGIEYFDIFLFTSYARDATGRITAIDGPRTDVSDVTSISYYKCDSGGECGQISTITNAAGHTTTFAAYNAYGQPTIITDANVIATNLAYDLRQRLTSVSIAGSTTSLSYDAVGNLLRTTYADGVYVENVYDTANRLTLVKDSEGNSVSWTLDNAGNRLTESIKDPQNQLRKNQQMAFDEINRLISMTYAHGGIEQYSYDGNNNLTSQLDAANRETLNGFDALDRLISSQDAIQGQTELAYNSRDEVTSVTDPEGKSTVYTYNGFGDQLGVDSPDTGVNSFSYDSAGNRVNSTDARGVAVTYTFDALNRLTNVIYPSTAENITYTYDTAANGIGRLARIDDQTGSVSFSYDARGNVTQVVQTTAGNSYTTNYQYNAADRPIGMTNPSDRQITYGYDASGRVNSVTSTYNGVTENLATGIKRLPFGPATNMTLGNGIPSTRSYDLDYRIESLNHGSVLQRNYAHNSVDNITAITDSLNAAQSQLFDYDALDRLSFATGGYGEQSFTYDGIGNRLSLETITGGTTQTQNYQYDANSHRLIAIAGERSFTYDAVGNTTNNGNAKFTYNDRNRMNSATANGVTTNYEINALGQRVRKSSSVGDTQFIYDLSGRLIAEADASGSVLVEYAYLDGEPLAMWRDDGGPVEPVEPGLVTPLSPIGTTDIASPVYSWEAIDDAIEYQMFVYDRVVGDRVYEEHLLSADVCADTTCSVTPTAVMNFSKNHFWRIRVRNAVGWGAWSEAILFDYLDSAPDAITAIAPIESVDNASPAYVWNDVGNASEYQVLVYDRVLGERVYLERMNSTDVCTAGTCTVTPSVTLNLSKNHFWRVRALNTGGWGPWTASTLFDYVDVAPASVTPIAPISAIDTSTPEYQWQDLGNATEYQMFVYDRVLQTRVHEQRMQSADVCSAGTCTLSPGVAMNFSKNHFWRIRALNTGGWGTWSDAILFDYLDSPPSIVTPLSPIGSIDTVTPTYTWEDVGNATEYQIFAYDRVLQARAYTERASVADLCSAGTCSFTPDATLNISVNHFWRVRALNSGGWGPWTDAILFENLNANGGQ